MTLALGVSLANAQQGPRDYYEVPSRNTVLIKPLPAGQLVLQADSVRWLKLTRMVLAGWKLDTVYKEGWYRLSDVNGGVIFWETSGTTLKKKDSTLSVRIDQFKGDTYSSLEMDEERAWLKLEAPGARLPEDSLVNDSVSKAEVYLRQNTDTTGNTAGLIIDNLFGANHMYLNRYGKSSMFGLDASFPGAVVGSSGENTNGTLNIGTKTKRFGTGWFTQIAASSISNPSWPTFPNAVIDARSGIGTAIFGGAGYQGTGVYGYQTGQYGSGVWGYSDVSYGVRATTTSGRAVLASSNGTGMGVDIYTESGIALKSKSATGLQFRFGNDLNEVLDSSMLMNSSGEIGIGTTSITGYKLYVRGKQYIFHENEENSNALQVQNLSNSGTAIYASAGGLNNTSGISGTGYYGVKGESLKNGGYGGYFENNQTSGYGIYAKGNTASAIFIGNVGIGATAPATALDVNGVITATSGTSTQWNTAYGWGNHAGLYAPASTVSSQWESVTDIGGHSGIATDSSSVIIKEGHLILGNYEASQTQSIVFTDAGEDAFTIKSTKSDDGMFRIYSDAEKGIFLEHSSGSVGIGTTTMEGKLKVEGDIRTENVKYTTAIESDHSGSGDIMDLTASASMGIGDVVFINSSGKAALCKADVIENCPYAFAICVTSSLSTNESGRFMTKGTVRDDTWNWTVGGLIYVSSTGTTGNTLTQTAPSGSNNVIMPVGVAMTADVMYFFGNVNSVEKQ